MSSSLGLMLKADSLFSSLSKQLSCFMNLAMPSPGEAELPWQTHTSPLLLPCFHPSSSAYCSGDSDTKRHEERGPGVNKQRMPLHVTPAWTDALAGNWGSWTDGWEEQTHTYAQIHYTHTHTQRHVSSNSFSFVPDMSRSSHRLQMSCVKYLGRTRLHILMGTFTFSIETSTVY